MLFTIRGQTWCCPASTDTSPLIRLTTSTTQPTGSTWSWGFCFEASPFQLEGTGMDISPALVRIVPVPADTGADARVYGHGTGRDRLREPKTSAEKRRIQRCRMADSSR